MESSKQIPGLSKARKLEVAGEARIIYTTQYMCDAQANVVCVCHVKLTSVILHHDGLDFGGVHRPTLGLSSC